MLHALPKPPCKAKIKECPYCCIDLDTPMNEVKGVKLMPPEYNSFHLYPKEKPYTKVEKENIKVEQPIPTDTAPASTEQEHTVGDDG